MLVKTMWKGILVIHRRYFNGVSDIRPTSWCNSFGTLLQDIFDAVSHSRSWSQSPGEFAVLRWKVNTHLLETGMSRQSRYPWLESVRIRFQTL